MKLLHIPTGLVIFVIEIDNIFKEEYCCMDERDYCFADEFTMCSDCPVCSCYYNKHKEEYIEI